MRVIMLLIGLLLMFFPSAIAAQEWELPTPETPPGNGFENPVDISELAIYTNMETGWVTDCDRAAHETESNEMQMWAERAEGFTWLLCIYNFPPQELEVDTNGFMLWMASEQGAVSFETDFVCDSDFAYGEDTRLAMYSNCFDKFWALKLCFPADLPGGEWFISLWVEGFEIKSITSDIDNVEASYFADQKGVYSVQPPDYDSSPFPPPEDWWLPVWRNYCSVRYNDYLPGDTLHIIGREYTPGETLTVALYTFEDVSNPEDYYGFPLIALPRYATEVTIDEDGRFLVPFTVQEDTLPSENYMVLLGDDLVAPTDEVHSPIPRRVFVQERISIAMDMEE